MELQKLQPEINRTLHRKHSTQASLAPVSAPPLRKRRAQSTAFSDLNENALERTNESSAGERNADGDPSLEQTEDFVLPEIQA